MVRELRWTFTHIIIIFSRTEGKYLPQDKGQVKEIPVRALKTKVMSWITTFTFDIIMRCHMWTEFSVAFEYVRENWPQERLFKCKKRFAYNLTERKRYIKQQSHIGSHIWFSAYHICRFVVIVGLNLYEIVRGLQGLINVRTTRREGGCFDPVELKQLH